MSADIAQTGGTQKNGYTDYICLYTSVDFADGYQQSCYINSIPSIVTGYYPFEGEYNSTNFRDIRTELKRAE